MGFDFQQFSIDDSACAMKVGTDGVLLGAWAVCPPSGRILDAGAGSGLISLMLAQRSPLARITAVEVDAAAAECCRRNAGASPFASRIDTVRADLAAWSPGISFDAIVSNPPFFTEPLRSPHSGRAMARHGLTFTALSLIDIAAQWLAHDGSLSMIAPAHHEAEITYHAEMCRLKVRRICHVYPLTGRPCLRVMLTLCRHDGPIEHSRLCVRDASGRYSDQFRTLTKNFYQRYPDTHHEI